jgi:uncharacterized phiE125 gp8 family phage protein
MTVPLSTIKSALKIDYSDDDSTLILYREAAEELVERETGLYLSPLVRQLFLARFEDTVVPLLPFTSVTKVEYQNAGNVNTIMPATDYWLDRSDGPAPILRFLEAPATYEGTNITVSVDCGYNAVPNTLVHCIIAIVGGWYNNPEAFQSIGLSPVPMSVDYILSSYRARSFIR